MTDMCLLAAERDLSNKISPFSSLKKGVIQYKNNNKMGHRGKKGHSVQCKIQEKED